jgi:hypothetical protein
MERKNYQKLVADILGTRPIAFNPGLAKITGSANAGLLLSQLLYWYKKGRNPEWFYKTVDELEEETTLTKRQQRTAIKKCKKLGLIDFKRMGIPAKRHFKIFPERIIDLWKTKNSTDNFSQQDGTKRDYCSSHFARSTTKSTKRLQTENGFNKIGDIIKNKYQH